MTIEAIDTEQLASRATSTSVTLLLLPRAIVPSSHRRTLPARWGPAGAPAPGAVA
ncbi:hypothetical protein GCM10011612_08780 [Actinomyces gaoshouyii]|uniref:Uncharacterized protein n=1 Tax=Actinomyces gaoshouyii TaxID=1960083 RepID=A0A8H9H8K7_9ACTO|nr:hypothetical protein GCM10011612_08780 [Actinomyces gaoshouyii]